MIVILSVATGMLAELASAQAATASCRVKNLSTDTGYLGSGANLQTAIHDASHADILRIAGKCVGNFTIGKKLTLRGRPTARYPVPTLDGSQDGSVLRIYAVTVTIQDLRIRNGKAYKAGGIFNTGDLILSGASSVRENRSGWFGAGIFNRGTVTLNDSSSVSENAGVGGVANTPGGGLILNDSSTVRENHPGGVFNKGSVTMNDFSSVAGNRDGYCAGIDNLGTVILNDSSSISGNQARFEGGGICSVNGGDLTLNGSSSVTGNTAGTEGGGIFNFGGVITLNGSSSVTGNTAGTEGGGIFIDSGPVYRCSDSVVLSPNTPDDPPTTTACA